MMCLKSIYNLSQLEERQETIAMPNMGHRLKGNKKEEQYRLLWSELEAVVNYNGTSPNHKAIVSCIRECRRMYPNADGSEQHDKSHGTEGNVTDAHRASVIRATTDSPMSPPHSMSGSSGGTGGGGQSGSGGAAVPADSSSSSAAITLGAGNASASGVVGLLGARTAGASSSSSSSSTSKKSFGSGGRSLFDVLATTERTISQKRIDFSGRLCTPSGQVAKLYSHLGSKDAESAQGRPADVK
uniref:Protein asunder n=1 Tax=Anopheles maculatus TaxID=74869 RepID=A0A182SIC2_9DIPT